MIDDIEPAPRRRMTAHTMGLRRRRIFARLREGESYNEIAEEEGVSATRIRQIVSDVLKKRRSVDGGSELAKLQLERLGPVMQLACDAVAAGDVTAIAPYLKVLDRFDRYQTIAGANQVYDDEARKKLFDKINRVAANLGVDEEFEEVRREIRARKEAAAAAAATVVEPGGQGVAEPPPGEEKKWFESGATS